MATDGWKQPQEGESHAKTAAVVAALGLFGVIGLTPAMAGSALNTDRSAEFKVAQSQETTGAATSKAKSKKAAKKPKPTKKQRYERSN